MKTQLVSVSEETSGTYCIHIEESCESGQCRGGFICHSGLAQREEKRWKHSALLSASLMLKALAMTSLLSCSWIGFIQKPVATVGPSLHLLSPLHHVNILRLMSSGSDSPFSSLLRKSLPAAIHHQPPCSGATPCPSLPGHLLSGL